MLSRFWGSDSKGCDKTIDLIQQHMPSIIKPCTDGTEATKDNRTLKRRRSSLEKGFVPRVVTPIPPPVKRLKTEPDETHNLGPNPAVNGDAAFSVGSTAADAESAREVIEFNFSLEILLKHDELRFIDQELAKCQVALEQLRRCHLMPYPTVCPTPQQMLDISSGKGASVRPSPKDAIPKWAAPFGVVDGPYARHYAKWLIPDPVFDASLAEWQGIQHTGVSKNAAESRTTRNSFSDQAKSKPRSNRSSAAQRLQALPSAYPTPRDKAGPCVLKRSNGQTVKLVCIDCHRDNFSSTQGFINHCRIAHKRDFKSHEEAAVHCGHPIEVDEIPSAPVAEDKPVTPAIAGMAHPLARHDKEVSNALLSRIDASLKMFAEGKLPGVKSIPRSSTMATVKKSTASQGPSKTPYLSRLMQDKRPSDNLDQHVADATAPVDIEDDWTADDESEDGEQDGKAREGSFASDHVQARALIAMRMPKQMTPIPPPTIGTTRPSSSSKGRSAIPPFSPPIVTPSDEAPQCARYLEELDHELSPNTATSNNAPSLVSDDGEYDDSDVGSSSEASDSGAESVSDVAEINIDEDEGQGERTPRAIRRGSVNRAVALKKEENRHVTFVSPVRGKGKVRRRKNV